MSRIRSDDSRLSAGTGFSGYSDETSLSFSSATTVSYESTSPSAYDFGDPYPSYAYAEPSTPSYQPGSNRSGLSAYTPSIVGWSPESPLIELYHFVVPKGRDPYLQLNSQFTPTAETPERVYLDKPRKVSKGSYPCMFPRCGGKQQVFNRPADLERHYKNVHASEDQKDRYLCDYAKCDRATAPFSRKDHFRDHLKDYHKEDLGCARGEKSSKDRRAWEKAQKRWQAERNITLRWWRCAKCLGRVNTEASGYECRICRQPCEEERQQQRRELYDRTVRGSAAVDTTRGATPRYAETPAIYGASCTTCGGTSFIEDISGGWESCPNCLAGSSSLYTSYSDNMSYYAATEYSYSSSCQ